MEITYIKGQKIENNNETSDYSNTIDSYDILLNDPEGSKRAHVHILWAKLETQTM